MSAPGFADHFSRVASDYARYQPTYPDALFDWIASLARTHDAVWDCACATGQPTVPSLIISRRFLPPTPAKRRSAGHRRIRESVGA